MQDKADGPLASPILLMYHRVCADDASRPSDFIVTASVFRKQMQYLSAHGYYTPRLSEVVAAGGRAPRQHGAPVVITFDDGYADNFEDAFPVLRDIGFTAAFFPVLDLRRRFNTWDPAPEMRAPLLSLRELRSMEEAGMEIGSHTITHPHLTRSSRSELTTELAGSRELLASIVARPLPVLAYPYGDVDERVKRAARDAGYEAALAVGSGPLEMRADLFEVRRRRVGNHSSDTYLKVLLSGAEKLYAWSKWRMRTGLGAVTHFVRERSAFRG